MMAAEGCVIAVFACLTLAASNGFSFEFHALFFFPFAVFSPFSVLALIGCLNLLQILLLFLSPVVECCQNKDQRWDPTVKSS